MRVMARLGPLRAIHRIPIPQTEWVLKLKRTRTSAGRVADPGTAPATCAAFFMALVVWLTGVTWTAAADHAVDSRSERMERAEAARIRGDLEGLDAVRVELEAAIERPDADLAALHYDAAYVLWRCLQNLHDVEHATAEQKKYPEQAREHVDALLALKPDSLEAKILNAAITGVEADQSMFSRLRLGRISYTITRDNAKHFPNHPRTRLQWGIVLLYAPAFVGGGSDAAIEQLEVAQANFKLQPAPAPWPNWGARESQGWLGMAHARAGRLDEARAIYLRALEREPGFAWVEKLLASLGPDSE